jgi:hypothetical protein
MTSKMRTRTIPILLLTLIATIAATAGTARATVGFEYLKQWRAEESGGLVRRIAVQHTTGHVLLAGAQGVDVYDTAGKHLATWTGFGSLGANGVAVDDTTEDIYVAESGEHSKIVVLGANGERLSTIGGPPGERFTRVMAVAIDQATGDIYVTDECQNECGNATSAIYVFNAAGEYRAHIKETEFAGVTFGRASSAVAIDDANDDVLVPAPQYGVVYVFHKISGTYTYEYVTKWTGTHTPAGAFDVPTPENLFQVSVDPEGYVLVSDNEHGVVEVFSTNDVGKEEYEESPIAGVPCPPATEGCGAFGAGHAFNLGVGAVAIDPASGDEYLVDYLGSKTGSPPAEIDVFSPPLPLPTVRAGVPSAVGSACARLNGVAEPKGTSEHDIIFEYGQSISYGTVVSAEPGEASATGGAVAVSTVVCGLLPGSEYHYRLEATNSVGTAPSVDQRLLTGPAIEGLSAGDTGSDSAMLSASIEPGTLPTTYHFAYWPESSPEAGAQIVPVPDASLPVLRRQDTVSELVTGLRADTTYRFKLVAGSAAGVFDEPQGTFTTTAVPAPVVATGASSDVGVNGASVSGSIDPRGQQTSYRFEYGPSAAYGSAWPTIDVVLGAMSGPRAVVVTLGGLAPDTTYHYRLVASGPGGTVHGGDETFTTGEYPQSIVQTPPVLETFTLPPEQAPAIPPKPKPKAKKPKPKHKTKVRKAKASPSKRKAHGKGARKDG